MELRSDRNEHHCQGDVIFEETDFDFRIPALLYVNECKTFLAFAERRLSSHDSAAKNLVLRTGTRQTDGSIQWRHTVDLMKAVKDGYRTMNPCPVFERETKTLFLFFICIQGRVEEGNLRSNQTRLCFITTKDGCETWSDLTDLTEDVGNINLQEFQTFAVGPGHGIQATRSSSDWRQTVTGRRLLIPAYVKTVPKQKSYSLVFYSDDKGQTWQAGRPMFLESGECQVAEVWTNEGRDLYLYCNARTLDPRGKTPGTRLEALSDDTGNSFTKLQSLSLPETQHGCQGSVLGFNGGHDRSRTCLLFSHPSRGPQAGEGAWSRRDLGVYLRESLQDGSGGDYRCWGEPYVIHRGKSGYSDLAQCEEKDRFACLMECGEAKHQRIVFQEFSLGEIPKPAQVVSSPCCVCGRCCAREQCYCCRTSCCLL